LAQLEQKAATSERLCDADCLQICLAEQGAQVTVHGVLLKEVRDFLRETLL